MNLGISTKESLKMPIVTMPACTGRKVDFVIKHARNCQGEYQEESVPVQGRIVYLRECYVIPMSFSEHPHCSFA